MTRPGGILLNTIPAALLGTRYIFGRLPAERAWAGCSAMTGRLRTATGIPAAAHR
ncbi:MAG TPA: hypothetical protein VLZ89_18255 [Anaerolineales bacterium]|nr:hypothetical protein [Anaerolineales bacterium]